jgi:hypothetical protein
MFSVLGVVTIPDVCCGLRYVFVEQAQEHGLVLLQSGRLIDRLRGDAVPLVRHHRYARPRLNKSRNCEFWIVQELRLAPYDAANSADILAGRSLICPVLRNFR